MDAIPSKDNCWIQLAERDMDVTQQCVSLEHMMNVMDSAIDSVEFLEGKIAVSHEVSQIDDAFIRLSIESMKYTCKMLYVDVPAQTLSLEMLDLSLSVESEMSFLERIVNAIRETYHKIVKTIKDTATKMYYTLLKLDKATESLKYHIGNLKSDVPSEKLSYEDKSNINRKFGAILAMNSGNETSMEKLVHMIMETEKVITLPKTTDKLTQEVRKDVYTQDLNVEDIAKKYFDSHNNGTVVHKLNSVFHSKLDKEMITDVDEKHVSVVEFNGHKCAGIIVRDKTLEYVTVEAQGVMTAEDTLVKSELIRLVDFIEKLNLQFTRFKEHVDKDMQTMNMFLDNLKYKVTYMESSADNERYKNNIRVVNYVTKTVPRIASGGVINYYVFLKNLLWLAKLNYDKIYENEKAI